MKIVTTQLGNNLRNLIYTAHKVVDELFVWEPTMKPVYDMIHELNPDVLFIDVKYIDKTCMRAIEEFASIKTVVFGSGVPKGFRSDLLCASDSLGDNVKQFIIEAEEKVLFLKAAASVEKPKINDLYLYECDVCIINNDSKNMPEKIILMAELAKDLKVRIYGDTAIPLNNYVGTVRESEVPSTMGASKVVIDWNGDKELDIIAAGSKPYTPYLPNLQYAPQDIKALLVIDKNNELTKEVLENNTYYNRLEEIFASLNIECYNSKIATLKEELLCTD